ncbi:MAG: hypothetical protein Q8R70_09465 [Methanoregula sp.]|nr:hypothetical protein [Methanoregula sp.]
MKFSHISVIAIILVVIAVSIAGCTSSSPASPAAPATGGAPSGGSAAPAGGSAAPAAGSDVTGATIFGSGASYNWIEYKMVVEDMTAYMKFEKSGKCTMRMTGKDLPDGGMTIDCTSKGDQTSGAPAASNPADVSSDVKFTFVGIEPVSVGAGTYPAATKYMIMSNGEKIYYWTAPGVPTFVKFMSPSKEGDVVMELNGWG